MINLIFNLANAASLAGMAPPALAGGAFGPATLPAGMGIPGMYLILNTEPANGANNRYVGIAGDIGERFKTRMATVTELGFSAAVMGTIGVFWGSAVYQDAAAVVAIPVPPGSPPWAPFVVQHFRAMVPVVGFAPAASPVPPLAYEQAINGANVHLERALVRLVLRVWGGHTVSNNALMAPYVNPTPHSITLILNWGAAPGVPAGAAGLLWPVGQNL